MKRPILYWVILFILGEVLYKFLTMSLVVLIGSIVLLILITGIRRLGRENRLLHLVGMMFFFLGVFCMYSWECMLSACDLQAGEAVTFQGMIQQREESGNGVTYIIRTSNLNEKAVATKIQLQLQEDTDLVLGSKIIGTGKVNRFSIATNPGGFDEESYQHGKGIMLSLNDVVVTREQKPFVMWREYLSRLQLHFANIYASLFDEKEASLAAAMVLGDKSNLDSDVKALYQRNGIAHLIAISGLHIAMIGGMLYRLLRKLIGSYPISACVGVTFIIAYGIMTGLSSATLRAIIMLVVSIGADVFGRRYDSLTAVFLALFLMLVQNPYQIEQVGFLLSFGAILGITLVNPVWKIWFVKLPKWTDGLFVSISVQLVLLPVMLYFFYEVPVYGILLNVVVVPLMNILLVFLILCATVGSIFFEMAELLVKPADWIFSLYEWLCQMSEKLPGHTFCSGRPEIWWIVLYYLLLSVVVFFAYQGNKRLTVWCILPFMLLFGVFFMPSRVQVCMFDVGQGDAIYVRTQNHKHILVDGGSSSKQKLGTYVLKNGLKFYGASVIDYVFVSHSDSDHYSGIKELFEEELIEIRNFVLPAITNPDDAYRELEKLAFEHGSNIYYMKKGDRLQIDDVEFTCLNPMKKEYEDKNTGSIVLQMQYHSFDMLMTGDLDQIGEENILQDISGTIEVLKVAHHGSATSSSESFLRKVHPQIACVSVGKQNRYGHPASEVMERLSRFAQKIYLTKDSGAITIVTDGNEYTASTFLK